MNRGEALKDRLAREFPRVPQRDAIAELLLDELCGLWARLSCRVCETIAEPGGGAWEHHGAEARA